MKKGIELPKETIDALLNGATKFVMPIKKTCNTCKFNIEDNNDFDYWNDCRNEKSEYNYEAIANIPNKKCNEYEPAQWFMNRKLQIGDEFYVQEEFCLTPKSKYCNIILKNDCGAKFIQAGTNIDWCKASEMTYEQSRIKHPITDIQIKKVQELSVQEKQNICILERNEVISFSDWIKKQDINYDDNPYVFLVKVDLV